MRDPRSQQWRGVLLVALWAAACGAPTADSEREAAPEVARDPRPLVAVTLLPLEMIVRELAGDRYAIQGLVPPGASPHAFEPTPGDVARVAGARVLVRVGPGIDDWASKLIEAAGRPLTVWRLDELSGERGSLDPHPWLDPVHVRDRIAPTLSQRLRALDPDPGDGYDRRLADFQAELSRLDRDIRTILAAAPGRDFVALHGAWSGFARRYGLRELGALQQSPGQEPSPRELAGLVATARRARLPAIVVEPQLEPRVARTLANEFGGEVEMADPLGDSADPERASYPALLRYNARAFSRALGGSRS